MKPDTNVIYQLIWRVYQISCRRFSWLEAIKQCPISWRSIVAMLNRCFERPLALFFLSPRQDMEQKRHVSGSRTGLVEAVGQGFVKAEARRKTNRGAATCLSDRFVVYSLMSMTSMGLLHPSQLLTRLHAPRPPLAATQKSMPDRWF
jgi:hypothetical protein